MDSIKAVLLHNGIVMSFHHRVTQSFTEFNQFEIKRIELRETLCYSVVKTFITRNNESFTLLGLKHLSIHYV